MLLLTCSWSFFWDGIQFIILIHTNINLSNSGDRLNVGRGNSMV